MSDDPLEELDSWQPIERKLHEYFGDTVTLLEACKLAALIDPDLCKIDPERAAGQAIELLIATRLCLENFARRTTAWVTGIARFLPSNEALRTGKDPNYLFFDLRQLDDPFRKFLDEHNAIKRVRTRSSQAHPAALKRLKLIAECVLVEVNEKTSKLASLAVPRKIAKLYIEIEAKNLSESTARSRAKRKR
jgi:hypothetical protein